MYITKDDHFGYIRGTAQCVTRGRFLLLLQPNQYKDGTWWEGRVGPTKWLDIAATCTPENTYAVVRRVALSQCGHFMMGTANLCGRWVSVSGAYGSDGLPMSLASEGRSFAFHANSANNYIKAIIAVGWPLPEKIRRNWSYLHVQGWRM
jgi:hypothetical protein